MKLIRYGNMGHERPGVQLDNGLWIDVTSVVPDYNEDFFASDGLAQLKLWLSVSADSAPKVEPSERLGAPVCNPGKIVCVGLNYSDHAREAKMDLPKEPILFFKATSSLAGPYDDLIIPKNSVKTDWEVELAVVIGKRANYIGEKEALDHIAGYCLFNDYSEREFQLERSGQWVKGKSCDTFSPLGPFIATKDEIADPHHLNMWLRVNGMMRQHSNTKNLIFKIPELVSYVSQFMSLMPGDIISTGTPSGVGMGLKPPQYLKPGDVVELGIDGLGTSRQTAKAYKSG